MLARGVDEVNIFFVLSLVPALHTAYSVAALRVKP